MKAFIVEPSNLIQDILRGFFADPQWEVEVMDSGQALLDRLTGPLGQALVCLAMLTRDLNGQEVAQVLRERGYKGPIVLITSHGIDPSRPDQADFTAFTRIFLKSNLQPLRDFVTDTLRTQVTLQQKRPRVLYVEDSQLAAKIVLHWAKDWNWDVTHYLTADEAWARFSEADWDLILTDHQLSGSLQGLDLVRAIRREKDNRLPVLVLSAISDQKQKVEILKSGANDFVAKPVEKEELQARSQTLLTVKTLFDELERQKQAILELAMRDQLTGLFNRHSLVEIAPKLFHQAYRQKRPAALMVIDIDHFKRINDSHGHQMGDLVLAETGQFLAQHLRQGDYAARFGGEEFLLILPDTPAEGAYAKAEDLRAGLERLNPGGLTITASFGLAILDLEQPMHFDELFSLADAAVYQSKANGRNRVT